MDGLLAKFHQQQINSSDTKSIKKHRQNFFISKNFGDNFFLGHIELHSDTDEDNINTLFSTINTFHRKDKEILIIESGDNNFLKKIIKKFPEYNFKSIIYPFKLP